LNDFHGELYTRETLVLLEADEKSSKVAKCFEPRLPWELEIANSLVTK
jgi:hypothetical protein